MHHSELGASTSSPLPREPVDLNSVDRPATPFSNPPATVRLSVSSETSNNLNRSNSGTPQSTFISMLTMHIFRSSQ